MGCHSPNVRWERGTTIRIQSSPVYVASYHMHTVCLFVCTDVHTIVNSLASHSFRYYMKYSKGRNYWATIGLWSKFKRKITPRVVNELLSGGGRPSFRYLLRVSLEGETRAKKKKALAKSKEGAKARQMELTNAQGKASDSLAAAKTAAEKATKAAAHADNEFISKQKQAKKGTHVDGTAAKTAAAEKARATDHLQQCQKTFNQVAAKYADKNDARDDAGLDNPDKLEDAETWNDQQFMLAEVNLNIAANTLSGEDEESTAGEDKRVDEVLLPCFVEGSSVYYVMDPLEARHGKDLSSAEIETEMNADVDVDGDATERRIMPVLQKKHIDAVAAWHKVSQKECEIVLQELSQRPRTSFLFDFLGNFGLLVSLALIVFVRGFTESDPDIECYRCGAQREMFLAMRAAQSAGVGGLQIALFASVANQFGAGTAAEAALDQPTEGNSTEATKPRDPAEVKLHHKKSEDVATKMTACPSWFGPREFDAITFKQVVLVRYDVDAEQFETEISSVVHADCLLLVELVNPNGDMLATKLLGNHFYDAVVHCSDIDNGPLGIVFVQPSTPSRNPATTASDAGRKQSSMAKGQPNEMSKKARQVKLPKEFAKDKRVRMRINLEGDHAKIPSLMITADDATAIKQRLSKLTDVRVSISDSPTPANPAPKKKAAVVVQRPRKVETVVEIPSEVIDPNMIKTPSVRRLQGSERASVQESTFVFECDTPNVIYKYAINAPNGSSSSTTPPFKVSTVSGAYQMTVSDSDNLKGGVNELMFYATKKGWIDSKVTRCTFDVWESSVATTVMRSRTVAGRRFHQNPNEVRFSSHAAIHSPFAYGCEFIEEQLRDIGLGNRTLYDLIASVGAVETNGFTEEQQAIYVIYRLGIPAQTPDNIANVLSLLNKFRELRSYDNNTGTVEVTQAISLVNGAVSKRMKVRASFKKSSKGEHNQHTEARCSFVEAMFDHLTLDRAIALGLRKFDSLEGSTFEHAQTGIEFADEIDLYLQLNEEERISAVKEDDGEPATTNVYTSVEEACRAEPARRRRHLPIVPPASQEKVKANFITRRAKVGKMQAPAVDDKVSVGIFYTVDMDLQPGDHPTLPEVPHEALSSGLASRSGSDWGSLWQNGWTSGTVPTLASTEGYNKRQFYYSSTETEEPMIPLLSRVEPEKYTFTTISLVDGLAPSKPTTTKLTIAGSVMKALPKPADNVEGDDDDDVDGEGGVDGMFNTAVETDDEDDDEEAMGFGFVLDEYDDDEVVVGFGDLGVESSRAAKETGKLLQSAWEEEEKRLAEENVPQSQQYLRKNKFKKAATARLTAEPGVHVENALKLMEEETYVTQARRGQAEKRLVAARTKKEVKSIKMNRKSSGLERWQPVDAATIEQRSRENAEKRRVERVEEQRLAAEQLRLEIDEVERKKREGENEKRRKKERKELAIRQQQEREMEALQKGEIYIDLWKPPAE